VAPRRPNPGRPATLPAGVLAAALLGCPGCGQGGGPSDYDKMVQAKQNTATSLAAAGVKTQEKQYPIGTGWVVDMKGVAVTDDLLRQVKGLGSVAELDLSKSTVTDQHLALMREIELYVLITRLDLSHTAVTDAGIDQMGGFIFLSELNLAGTKVTPAAVDRLKAKIRGDHKARLTNPTVKLK
jgi:hypothetical protein